MRNNFECAPARTAVMARAVLSLFSLLLFYSLAQADHAAGTFEIRDGAGRKIGQLTSTVQTSTYTGKPSLRIETTKSIKSSAFMTKYAYEQKDVAEILKNGLVYFKREITENDSLSTIEGRREGTNLALRISRNGQKFGRAVPLNTFKTSEFEIDLPGSPFWNMKEGDGRAARVFVVDKLQAVKVIRNVTGKKTITIDGNEREVLIINTNVAGVISTAYYDVKSLKLLRKESAEQVLHRLP